MRNTQTRNFGGKLRMMAMIVACGLTLGACATGSQQSNYDGVGIEDPMEDLNRQVFAFNTAVDNIALKPVARGYRAIVPQPIRTGVRNFLNNLRSPIVFANQILQGDPDGAGNALTRAAINTTVGIGGLVDVAAHAGYKDEPEDFGQTLAVWGVPHGPYMVIPLLGPSSLRDGTGMLVDSFADPVRLYLFNTDREGWHYARIGMTVLDKREELLDALEDLEKNSFDYYAAMRSAYVQRRDAQVRDVGGRNPVAAAIPDYEDEL
jgi:phospholipid-binding lipoprotein MlaA